MSSKIAAKKTLNSNTIIDTNNEISEESYSRLVKMDFYFNGKKLSYEYLTDNLFQIVWGFALVNFHQVICPNT